MFHINITRNETLVCLRLRDFSPWLTGSVVLDHGEAEQGGNGSFYQIKAAYMAGKKQGFAEGTRYPLRHSPSDLFPLAKKFPPSPNSDTGWEASFQHTGLWGAFHSQATVKHSNSCVQQYAPVLNG